MLQEKQCRDRHISGGDRHHLVDVDDDGELDDAGDGGHVEDGDYDHYEDDEDVDGEKSFEEKGLLSRVTRTAAVRRSGPTARRPFAVVGARRLSGL